MTAAEHGFKVLAPWYTCERGHFDRFDPSAHAPTLQKYASAEFVRTLVADPRDSLLFDPDEDVWSYPVPVGPAHRGPGRARFATHQLVRTRLRKLYQPSHERFYAVVVELFCDRPGLPRPQSAEGLDVGFVMRRRTVEMDAEPRVLRTLSRRLSAELLAAGRQPGPDTGPHLSEARDVLWADLAHRTAFEEANRELLDRVGLRKETQAWMAGAAGGQWRRLGEPPPEGRPGDREQELPMWRLPGRSGDCPDGARPPQRSLWFGVVPTSSADHDDLGAPKLDDRSVYELRVFVRRPAGPGHEQCPPRTSWSKPTEPFRLASFFDPEGTRNRKVSITMPDFRAVAARAAAPPGPGGVAITSPPGSQMSFDPGGGTPASGSVTGTVPRTCTFALEIFMIVAYFVFSMFLPIVVFLFQLWWLLALRFCLPPSLEAAAALKAFFAGGKSLADMGRAETDAFDELLGTRGAGARLRDADGAFAQEDLDDLVDLVTPPATAPLPVPPRPEPPVEDPLCEGG
ncbi:hypothetical protein OV450_4843 [Actinobacteria bacterium OV450]|uniref:hypothetical protein n=1 Tax=Streptomyces sp. NPDC056387 TaxID=3345803 RepID=UPI0006BAC7C1|nr:hypothetical protein OV450_4843 [Actinobacteria bacterium OV450]